MAKRSILSLRTQMILLLNLNTSYASWLQFCKKPANSAVACWCIS